MSKRVLLVAAVLAAASMTFWLAAPAGAAAGAFVEQGKLQANDGAAQDALGFSVAISGDTAVVGAPADATGSNSRQGAAYVYVRNGSTWTQQQKLTASDGVANDEFGYAVAITGDTIFVGRHFTQVGNNARTRGAVYVFTRTGSTWTQAPAPLTPSDAADGDLFGSSLAADGGTLVVGALQKNNGGTFFQGAAYVFSGSGATWSQQGKLLANDGGFASFFGFSVAVSGDTAVVGAPGQAGVSADGGRGAAYTFVRSGGAWSQQQKLLASDGAAGDAFGFSVGVSNDTAVVGSRLDTVNGVGGQGSVYVFTRAGAVWAEQQHLFGVEATQRNDTFGGSVAINGDTIAVGSPAHEFQPGVANHGAVYVFTRAGDVWTRRQKLLHSDFAPDALGTSVAFDGSSIVAGAPSKSSGRGAAYVFAFRPNDPNRVNGAETTQSSFFGENVDVDGDTAVVGASFDDVGGVRKGAAYVFVRNGSAWAQQARLVAPDGLDGDDFGKAVAVNGNTVVVGAYDHKVGSNTGQGAAYVYVRTGSAWALQQKLTAADGGASDQFGLSVAVNGDTAVVGALGDDLNATNDNLGSAYVFTRGGATWSQQGKLTADAGTAGGGFGTEVAVSGDTAVVGAPLETVNSTTNRGAAYVFRRAGSAWAREQRIVLDTGESGDLFGISVDVDGDTAAFSAAQGFSATAVKGAVFVYTRAGAVWTQQQKLLSSDLEDNDYFGRDVSVSGDTLIAGAFGDRVGGQDLPGQGSAYVFRRAGSTWTEQRKLTAADGSGADFFGQHVAVSGDAVIVGAKGDDVLGNQEQGSAYIFSLSAGTTPTPTPTPGATPTPTPSATPTPTPTPSPTPTPTPLGTVQFATSTVQADESAGGGGSGVTFGAAEWWRASNAAAAGGSAALTVTRTDATQAASVDYATQDGTASARTDYSAVFGTLRFAAGESSKSVVVAVTDDRFQEASETFSVVLSNPSGVALGSPSAATVQVTSDDAANGPNPVADPSFDAEFFVRQHYADFLGREPDAPGLQFWKNDIDQCETRPAAERQGCREVKRVHVSAAFFLSIEFQETGYFVYRLHHAAFGTGERLGLSRFLADTGEARQDVVVGQGNWEQQLAANKQAFALAFVGRPQFIAAYPAALTPAQFVDALNANTGGSLSQAERDARVAELAADNTNAGRAAVLLKVVDDADFRAREFNRAFVLMQYFGYLRRAPDEPPDGNFDGYNFWLSKLNQFGGRFIDAEMVKAFITSTEYRHRFGP
ncbi:MAG TPA: Calx-beta domain-containing protein [Pyrinomonadaceae bacterium]